MMCLRVIVLIVFIRDHGFVNGDNVLDRVFGILELATEFTRKRLLVRRLVALHFVDERGPSCELSGRRKILASDLVNIARGRLELEFDVGKLGNVSSAFLGRLESKEEFGSLPFFDGRLEVDAVVRCKVIEEKTDRLELMITRLY